MKSKSKFTVVGLYHDNSQVYVGWTSQSTPVVAAKWCRRQMAKCGGGAVLSIFRGHLIDQHGKDELYHE